MAEKTANQNKVAQQGGLDFLIKLLVKEAEKKEKKDETLLYEVIRSLSVMAQQNPPHIKQVVSFYFFLFIFYFILHYFILFYI